MHGLNLKCSEIEFSSANAYKLETVDVSAATISTYLKRGKVFKTNQLWLAVKTVIFVIQFPPVAVELKYLGVINCAVSPGATSVFSSTPSKYNS